MISISVQLSYTAIQPSDLLLQIEAAASYGQELLSSELHVEPRLEQARIASEENVGQRLWLHVERAFECRYQARVDIMRPATNLASLAQTPLPALPAEAVTYLMASRYCHIAPFGQTVMDRFSGLSGGGFVQAARDWIEQDFTYAPGASNEFTSAHDTLFTRQGVCRDYAHVLIALARSVAIPARMVSCYAPDVSPQDFHAVVEVYVGGGWHLVDPTGMANPAETVMIGVGRDAADVSFMTAYGGLILQQQTVEVRRTA